MNWYKHHLGDYDSHTSHLSWDEDLAYTRLLRAYYRRDGPIPDNETYRLARAISPEQRAAVDVVLAEFFKKTKEGWRNKRADVEISAYKEQAEINRRIATNRSTNRPRTVNASSTVGPPSQIPEPDTRKNLAQKCAHPDCKKPGTRTRSTNGGGPWYCSEHADRSSGPQHVTELLNLPADPPTALQADQGKGKFDD